MNISVSNPSIISKANPDIKNWGPWQFPRLFNNNGVLYAEFHIGNDSALDYGKNKIWFLSHDEGLTWHKTDDMGGIGTDDGLINTYTPLSIPADKASLPQHIGIRYNYGIECEYYLAEDMKDEYRQWSIMRKKDSSWEKEPISVRMPGHVMRTSEGVLSGPYFHQLYKAYDNSIWAPMYEPLFIDGKLTDYYNGVYLKSTDNGKTFYVESTILYEPPYQKDPLTYKRLGFTEPSICFIDNDNAFTLLRTTDGNGIGPLYISWSKDKGKTWSKPEFFDDRGVWPQSILLNNGVCIAGYGRPGLFIRVYYKGQWMERIAIVPPGQYQTDTCSYCAMQPVSDNAFVIVYSDFKYVHPDKSVRKTILSKKVTLEV